MNMNPKKDRNILSSQQDILVAKNLCKSYGSRRALQGLTFSLQAGRVLGFLGPNGAGKTTSIRILTTIMEPESGHFTVDGIGSEHPNEIRRKIGVLPEQLGFPRQMTGIEYLTYFGQLYGKSAAEARNYGRKLLEDVGLLQRGNSLIGSYSHGMRQRIGIARALVNHPIVVFLDEPTLGLDPRGQQELLELIQRIAREQNAGVVLCSHLLSEVEGVCDDVVILNLGQIVARGTVTEVIGQVQKNILLNYTLRIQILPQHEAMARDALLALPYISRIESVNETEGLLRIRIVEGNGGEVSNPYDIHNEVLGKLIRANITIIKFEAEGGKLQDVFLQLTEDTVR
jgi:ABC-2 type transport system ATP-binding protein